MITFIFPGQGSQTKGMGGTLFDKFKELTAEADEILGYSIKELCVEDPNLKLSQTQYTQPALYVVNALCYLTDREYSIFNRAWRNAI
ncbi:acyltransferase domain-containing protein [Pelosinus baikalensis]|uniref:[acyl-carrier-protein] S-malonyltransferase n=1 Tax=Pelosinus baikalensis TaxID=2892015 RepID=A0ABS8HY65_9FIRM|nr:acyltransferase domain-containing protein [Pelosinus baikalensis]MCC5467072.1 acyltransferase domain-containing protein [Pelosinus baikalensis]